jgi:NAD+ synthase (glutamine-hydrolysing)
MVGGQDELVFDGDSIIVAADGGLLARGPQFEQALIVADLELAAATAEQPGDAPADAQDGTTMTIRRLELAEGTGRPDRLPDVEGPVWPRLSGSVRSMPRWSPACGTTSPENEFRSVILALSGGIDSALTATIAARTLSVLTGFTSC